MTKRKTPGQIAYEEDVRRWPDYAPGVPRPRWDGLGAIAKASWEKNPTPREWLGRKVA